MNSLKYLILFVCVFEWSLSFSAPRRELHKFRVHNLKYSPEPTKYFNGPVLSVRHPETNCLVHLVGVSHGSEASASLVSDILTNKNPSAVVVELCEDRFITLSSYAKVRPKGNSTLETIYDDLQAEVNSKLKKYNKKNTLQKIFTVARFAKEQGAVTGIFVMFGVLVGAMQKLISATDDDEFTTAIKMSDELNIPLRLGDAPQNDTLKSIKSIMSLDTINPTLVWKGAQALAFSTFGLFARTSNEALDQQKRPPDEILEKSQWLNIPVAYMRSSQLSRSLRPIAYLAGALILAEQLPIFSTSVDAAVYTTNLPLPWLPSTLDSVSFDPAKFLEAMQHTADLLSILLMIRLTKIIGTDRDAIIADKVMTACREFPDKEIVVVIGMLHCNGVARWLMSGVPPLAPTDDAAADVVA